MIDVVWFWPAACKIKHGLPRCGHQVKHWGCCSIHHPLSGCARQIVLHFPSTLLGLLLQQQKNKVLLKSTFSGIITHHCCHCCMMYPMNVIYLLQAPRLDCLGPSPNCLRDLRQQSLQGYVVTGRVAEIVLKSLRHVEWLEADDWNPLSYPLTAWKHAP